MADDEKPNKDAKELIKLCRKRYKACADNPDEQRNRRDAINDLKFVMVPGEQWELDVRTARGKDRPMYTFNDTKVKERSVINDIRANRPQPKFRATEDNDKETAETLEGLFRNCWTTSDGDSIMDKAAEYQVIGGMGAWRITTEWSKADPWSQDICVEPIRNPFCLYADPGCTDECKRDAMYWVLTDKIKKSTYESRYPNKKLVSFDAEDTFDDNMDWVFDDDEGYVRICEYWWKEPKKRTIALLSDGRTIDLTENQLPPDVQIVKQRDINDWQIKMAILSGDAILEGPVDWAGSMFPFVVVYGEYIVIDGHTYWYGMTRFAKDPQRAHNQAMTGVFESIAASPQSKFWATATQAEGHTQKWGEAHEKNFPFLLYNHDPNAPGAPQRMGPADVPVALIQASQMSTEALKNAMGIFDPAIGKQSNVTSGVALRSQVAQSKGATFNYPDNMAKAMQYTGEIYVDLVPKILDTQKVVRILGSDGQEKYVKLYEQGPDGKIINDLGRGKYDVTVTVGANFATQRQEAVESYGQIAQTNPAVWGVAGDLIFKAMDLPYADQIAERMKALLPPQIQQQLGKDKPVPPEVQQAMSQVNMAAQQVQQHGQLVQAAQQELEQMKTETDQGKAELEKALANLKTEEAKFNTMKAQFETEVVKSQAELQSLVDKLAMGEQTQQQAAQVKQDIDLKLNQAVEAIGSHTQDFIQQAAYYLKQVGDQVQQHTSVVAQPRTKQLTMKRVNGQLVGEVSDGINPPKQVSISRTPEGITGTVQ